MVRLYLVRGAEINDALGRKSCLDLESRYILVFSSSESSTIVKFVVKAAESYYVLELGGRIKALCYYLDTVLVPVQHVVMKNKPSPPEHGALCVEHSIALLVQVACNAMR